MFCTRGNVNTRTQHTTPMSATKARNDIIQKYIKVSRPPPLTSSSPSILKFKGWDHGPPLPPSASSSIPIAISDGSCAEQIKTSSSRVGLILGKYKAEQNQKMDWGADISRLRVFWMQNLVSVQDEKSGMCAADVFWMDMALMVMTDTGSEVRATRAITALSGALGSEGSLASSMAVLMAELRYRVVTYHSPHDDLWETALAARPAEETDEERKKRELQAKSGYDDEDGKEAAKASEARKEEMARAVTCKETGKQFVDLRKSTAFGKVLGQASLTEFLDTCAAAAMFSMVEKKSDEDEKKNQIPSSSWKTFKTMVSLCSLLYPSTMIASLVLDASMSPVSSSQAVANLGETDARRKMVDQQDKIGAGIFSQIRQLAQIETQTSAKTAMQNLLSELHCPAGAYLFFRRKMRVSGEKMRDENKRAYVVMDIMPTVLSTDVYADQFRHMSDIDPAIVLDNGPKAKPYRMLRDDLLFYMFCQWVRSTLQIDFFESYVLINEWVYSSLHRFVNSGVTVAPEVCRPFVVIYGKTVSVRDPINSHTWVCANKFNACVLWVWLVHRFYRGETEFNTPITALSRLCCAPGVLEEVPRPKFVLPSSFWERPKQRSVPSARASAYSHLDSKHSKPTTASAKNANGEQPQGPDDDAKDPSASASGSRSGSGSGNGAKQNKSKRHV